MGKMEEMVIKEVGTKETKEAKVMEVKVGEIKINRKIRKKEKAKRKKKRKPPGLSGSKEKAVPDTALSVEVQNITQESVRRQGHSAAPYIQDLQVTTGKPVSSGGRPI